MCANLSSDSYRFFVRAGVTDPDEQRQLYDLLIECDGDFVPPLSFRRSTTQAALSGSEHNPDGVRDYFNALIAQHVVLCAGPGRIVGFLSFRPEYTCDALSDGATYCYLSTMAVSHACRGQHISPRLYRAAMDWAREHLPGRPVLLRTWSTNRAQAHLMPELGFEEVLRLPNDRGCGVDTVYYRHENTPSA